MENMFFINIGSLILILFVFIVPVIVEFLFWFFIIKMIMNAVKRNKNRNYFKNNIIENNHIEKYVDISKDKLEVLNNDDIEVVKNYFYDIFMKFETAYNNLDYNVMKKLSTNQLFQNYYTGITLDLKVGKKRIISDIKKEKVVLFDIDNTPDHQIVSLMIEVSYINYTINKEGNIISGNRDQKVNEKFEVQYRKNFNQNEVIKCPNCGAAITGNKCEYCRTDIKNEEYKISSIKKIIG